MHISDSEAGISRECRHSSHRETIQLAPDEIGLRSGSRKSDGTVQCVASFIEPIQLLE
jgi:hypothetical protein